MSAKNSREAKEMRRGTRVRTPGTGVNMGVLVPNTSKAGVQYVKYQRGLVPKLQRAARGNGVFHFTQAVERAIATARKTAKE